MNIMLQRLRCQGPEPRLGELIPPLHPLLVRLSQQVKKEEEEEPGSGPRIFLWRFVL